MDKKERVEALRGRIIDIIESQLDIVAAASKAPDLEDPEAAAEMTKREQRIAAHALLSPREAPVYLQGALGVLRSAAKASVTTPEENAKGVVFNVVMPSRSVEEWEASRKLLQSRPDVIDVEAENKK